MNEGEALKRLIKHFYVNWEGKLEWGFQTGVSLDEVDEELSKYLEPYLSNDQKKDLKEYRAEHD